MKLFRISQDVNDGYDTFDSAVVVAENEDMARTIHPRVEVPPEGWEVLAQEWRAFKKKRDLACSGNPGKEVYEEWVKKREEMWKEGMDEATTYADWVDDPLEFLRRESDSWVTDLAAINVEYLGEADAKYTVPGVILASFHAG